jgi:hypothetical protein
MQMRNLLYKSRRFMSDIFRSGINSFTPTATRPVIDGVTVTFEEPDTMSTGVANAVFGTTQSHRQHEAVAQYHGRTQLIRTNHLHRNYARYMSTTTDEKLVGRNYRQLFLNEQGRESATPAKGSVELNSAKNSFVMYPRNPNFKKIVGAAVVIVCEIERKRNNG